LKLVFFLIEVGRSGLKWVEVEVGTFFFIWWIEVEVGWSWNFFCWSWSR